MICFVSSVILFFFFDGNPLLADWSTFIFWNYKLKTKMYYSTYEALPHAIAVWDISSKLPLWICIHRTLLKHTCRVKDFNYRPLIVTNQSYKQMLNHLPPEVFIKVSEKVKTHFKASEVWFIALIYDKR